MTNKIVLRDKMTKKITIAELTDRFEISNQADGKSPKTTRWYTEILDSFVFYLESKHLGSDISVFNINVARDYLVYLRNRPRFSHCPQTGKPAFLSPKTIQCHVRTLKAFSSWSYRDGYTSDNRLGNLKIPRAPDRMVEPLTPEETKKVLRVINRKTPLGKRNHTIVVLMLDSGLRVSEIASLTMGHINLEKNCLKVMGKGGKERLAPIGDYSRTMLYNYIENGRPKSANGNTNNLFLSSDGNPLSVNALKLLFSRLAKLSGVRKLHAHLCRHTFATNYLLNGGDVFSLKEILGHTTLEMVNHYLHFTSAQLAVQHHQFSPMDKLQSK